jgi:hypothetical protein
MITKDAPDVATIKKQADYKDSMTIMLSSDWHFDSAVCDREMLTQHLKMAEEKNAVVCVFGDMLDVMQGRYDPRRSPEELKDEYKTDSYFDAVVADAAKFLSQFDLEYILCSGNHEESVLKHNGINLLSNVSYRLRYEYQKKAICLGYSGYIPLVFRYKKGSAMASKLLYFQHGSSTSAKVTRGVIWTNRQGVWMDAPDYVVNGHLHTAYSMPIPVERFVMKSKRKERGSRHFFRTPGYKNSITDGGHAGYYESSKHREPSNKGCYFLTLLYSHTDDTIEKEILDRTI